MKSLKLVAMTIALVTVITQVHADQTTNLVQTLRVRLLALKQGGTTTNRNTITTSVDTDEVNSREVIGSVGAALGNNFSRSSRLVLVTPLGGGGSSIEIRDGSIKTDVTSFFVLEQVGGSVNRSVTNRRTGETAQTIYSIQRLALQDSPSYPALTLHFDVRGLGLDTTNRRDDNGPRLDLIADVTGSGDSNGGPIVILGSIDITGGSLEVVTADIPPGV